ncbi:MAG: nucleotidyltransferase substrate binding protein [Spiroplasmataceae bacterium]|nr:nucleotidyltransferase substrate binding protein [Spiroplasmataceae bacterium]
MPKYILKKTSDIEPLLNMSKLMKKILAKAENEIDEMAAVQAFEISFELAWHTCQKVVNYKGEQARFPRDAFRLAAQAGLIKDPEIWFEFMDKRNETSHAYDINVLEEVFNMLPKFIKEFDKLIKNLEKLE